MEKRVVNAAAISERYSTGQRSPGFHAIGARSIFLPMINYLVGSLYLSLYFPDVPFGSNMAGASLLCLSFLGFDALTTLSEETKKPDKVIPRAIMLVTFFGGVERGENIEA